MDPGNFVYLVSVNIWSEMHILQAINCACKIISPRASETLTDKVIFQAALRKDVFTA